MHAFSLRKHRRAAEVRRMPHEHGSEFEAIDSAGARTKAVTAPGPRPYSNPYAAGFGLGLVLLAAFVIMGRGLGASGAFSSLVASAVCFLAPHHTAANEFYAEYMGEGTKNPLMDWLVFEVLGVFAGGLLSAALAGRIVKSIERGPSITNRGRLIFAFIGGALMGIGSHVTDRIRRRGRVR
jgi:uncharacterized protein